MTLSNKQMDEAAELAHSELELSIQNRNNNNPDYVGSRYNALHGYAGNAVPVQQGARIEGPLFSVPEKPCSWGPDGKGIVAALRDLDGKLGKYLVEINGNNGVEVTRKL